MFRQRVVAAVQNGHRLVLGIFEDARDGRWQVRRGTDGRARCGPGGRSTAAGDCEGCSFLDAGDVGGKGAFFVRDGALPVGLAGGDDDLGVGGAMLSDKGQNHVFATTNLSAVGLHGPQHIGSGVYHRRNFFWVFLVPCGDLISRILGQVREYLPSSQGLGQFLQSANDTGTPAASSATCVCSGSSVGLRRTAASRLRRFIVSGGEMERTGTPHLDTPGG